MNENNQFVPDKKLSRRRLQLVAIGSTVVAILVLLTCARTFLEANFLKDGDPVNPALAHAMRGMIKALMYVVMPALSLMLIINSYLLWACLRKFYTKSDK